MTALVEEGYAEPITPVGRLMCWKTTIKGRQLSLATAAKPISRANAEKKLSEFLERVKIIRDDPRFLYKVTRVAVFGSYLSDSKNPGDIDLAVGLARKEKTRTGIKNYAGKEATRRKWRAGRSARSLI